MGGAPATWRSHDSVAPQARVLPEPFAAKLVIGGLGLGFLVHADPLDDRAIYRYLKACDPLHIDVSLLSIADRLATGGHKAEVSTERHVAVAMRVLPRALEWSDYAKQQALVRGDELARALGIEKGPRLGELLAAIDEARYAGEVSDAAAAIDLARTL